MELLFGRLLLYNRLVIKANSDMDNVSSDIFHTQTGSCVVLFSLGYYDNSMC